MKNGILLMVAFALVSGTTTAKCTFEDVKVEKGPYKGESAVTMDNGLLKLVVVPAKGGRVIRLTDLKNKSDVITVPDVKKFQKFGHYERTLGGDKMEWVVQEQKDSTLKLVAENENFRMEKTITLLDDAPGMDIKVSVLNKGKEELPLKFNSMNQFDQARGGVTNEVIHGHQHEQGKFHWGRHHRSEYVRRAAIMVSPDGGYAHVFVPLNKENYDLQHNYMKHDWFQFVVLSMEDPLVPGKKQEIAYRYVYIDDPSLVDRIPEGVLGETPEEDKAVRAGIKQGLALDRPKTKSNPEQYAILKKGVDEWNAWRKKNPDAKVCLAGENIKGDQVRMAVADMHDADLSRCNLYYWGMSKCDFRNTDFTEAIFGGSDFRNADVSGANFTRSNPYKCLFDGATAEGTCFYMADCFKATFEDTNLKGANFEGARLFKARITGADIRNCNFNYADLDMARLTGCLFDGATFTCANFYHAVCDSAIRALAEKTGGLNLDDAFWVECDRNQFMVLLKGVKDWNAWRKENPNKPVNLEGIYIRGNKLDGIDLHDAHLASVLFYDVNLNGADLRGADMRNACLGATFEGADVSGAVIPEKYRDYLGKQGAKGLEKVKWQKDAIILN